MSPKELLWLLWLLCNLSLLRITGTTYLWDEITIVDRFSFSFLWINCLLIRNLSRICDHMTADTCLRIATVLNLSQKYSRLHHYTCFVESRICQRKFILKWLHQKGQTKNKKTIKPRNLGLLSYWTLWTLWDWVGKEFKFVTTWPPMAIVFFFTKIKRPLRALSAIYRSQLRQMFRRF